MVEAVSVPVSAFFSGNLRLFSNSYMKQECEQTILLLHVHVVQSKGRKDQAAKHIGLAARVSAGDQ